MAGIRRKEGLDVHQHRTLGYAFLAQAAVDVGPQAEAEPTSTMRIVSEA